MKQTMTGGCQCGRVRYSAQIFSDDAYLCHCRMCQRATGGVSIAFVNLKKADLHWAHEPDYYASSPIAHRPFCSACGTPLGFAYPDSENIDLTVGSFDDPSRFVPRHHFGVETMHEAWIDTTDLPRYRIDQNPSTVDRWMNKVGKLPD
ncbi:GFA family protein [Sphingomonas montanisoli]|uniref:GFA family protein n=1 Tax=Sphingomonas montanisoli TaxID=2606412 RepID=A0A5D9CE36_9SPHN|nr:GFA family protein [Sphingomonas montanisoli]TZG29473.1 GFA family protein [Sphingomonas montanisoli]